MSLIHRVCRAEALSFLLGSSYGLGSKVVRAFHVVLSEKAHMPSAVLSVNARARF